MFFALEKQRSNPVGIIRIDVMWHLQKIFAALLVGNRLYNQLGVIEVFFLSTTFANSLCQSFKL